MTRRILLVLALTLAALIPAGAANAAADKLTVLASWTQPTAASTAAWRQARLNQGSWSSYGFDWSTDYCTDAPNNPLGFKFDLSCAHHDFGYRNYRAVDQFAANKDRVDSMFYADLRRSCVTYNVLVRPACYSLAWVYYEAVHLYGSTAAVRPADISQAARQLEAATR